MRLPLLIAVSMSAIFACSKTTEKKSTDSNPPTENPRPTANDDTETDRPASQTSDGKTTLCNYSFEEDKSVDHFSVLNRAWRSSNELLKTESEMDGEIVEVLGGFRLLEGIYQALNFIFKKYANEHYALSSNDKKTFKFEKIAISKPITDGKFEGYRLIVMSGVSDYFLDVDCMTTSYKLEKYGDQEELSMAGWVASKTVGDVEYQSKESFFEGKYATGYIQK